jgi:hypothetical protein
MLICLNISVILMRIDNTFSDSNHLPINPYTVGIPIGNTPMFVGREDILQEVHNLLQSQKQNAIVFYGHRKMGKASILLTLDKSLQQQGHYPIMVDLLSIFTPQKLQKFIPLLAREISRYLGKMGLGKMIPNLDADNSPEITFRQTWLPKLLNILPPDTKLVLLFTKCDEAYRNNKFYENGATFFSYWYDLFSIDPKRLKFVFVFVIRDNFNDIIGLLQSQFKNLSTKRISLLDHDNTIKLIRFSETNNNLYWNSDAVEKVWQLTCGHPFLTQHLCSRILVNLYDKSSNNSTTVTLKDVEDATPSTLEMSENLFYFEGLSSAEQFVLFALASAGTKAITVSQLKVLLNKSDMNATNDELHNMLHQLQTWDFIESTSNGYRFRVELFRRWIAENKPLSRVKKELYRIEHPKEELENLLNDIVKEENEIDAAFVVNIEEKNTKKN